MSYVPPHRRVQEDSSSSVRPKPVAPPPLNRNNRGDRVGRSSRVLKPDVDIKYARNNIRKWFAIDGNGDTSNLLLEFKPFHGESFEHLRDQKLFTVSANPPENGGLEVESNLRSLAINDASASKEICERVRDDLREAFHNVLSYIEATKPDYVKPTFWARFGRILFHGGGLAWHERITVDLLAKTLKGETSLHNPVRKTFDTNLQKANFEALREKILAGLQTLEFEEKENYFIQVEDNLRPDVILGLKCVTNSEDGGQLKLKKIEINPVRHFVADISCVNKFMDLRLILVTKKYLTELSEEERDYIGGIVKSACIEKSAKGGLHWPLGGDCVRDRFRVKGSWHRKVTTIVGKLWTIKLQHVNRAEFKASSGRVSDEVDLKLTSLTKCLRDQVQWDEENIMNMLENILEWVWTECL